MYFPIKNWPQLLLIAFTITIYSCQEDSLPPAIIQPPPPPQLSAPAPPEDDLVILPFPAHFTLVRRDLSKFSATINIGKEKEVKRQNISLRRIPAKTFDCYTLDVTRKWLGSEKGCDDGSVFGGAGKGFWQAGFFFYPMHDDGEYPSRIVSVWKPKGDSLTFYTLLDKYFLTRDENTNFRIDSMTSISARQKRIYGQISWKGRKQKRMVQPWSAIWTLPNKLELR